jgi:sec-independent protein translocase protein TatA
MGGLSLPHLIILALVVLILFGRGRISEMMGDFGKGVKSFKQGMAEETDRPVTAPPRIEQQAGPSAPAATPVPPPGYAQAQPQPGQVQQTQPAATGPAAVPAGDDAIDRG